MSGAALCAALTELGFDGEDPLDADALEWPFQYEEARPLLAWICSCLRPSNVLSPSHLAQYEQLVEEGRLLEGEDLDSAFDSISAFSSKKDNQEAVFGSEETILDIREAKLAYRAEVFELQKQLARQQAQFDLLAGQASTLIQGRRARVTAMSAVSGQLISLDEQLSSRNLEMNAVLGRITATTQELAHYHSGDDESIYLAYSDFHPYVVGDLACTKELNRWFSKQFEKGPFRLVAEEGKSKCSWVSLDDITNGLIRGDSEKSHHHQRVAELQRLRSIFATSERQWIEAQVENAKQQAILSILKSQVSSDEAHIHRDIHSLRRKGSELAGELSTLSQKVQAFVSEIKFLFQKKKCSKHCHKIAFSCEISKPRAARNYNLFLQILALFCYKLSGKRKTLVTWDYDLKVMRQEYYINRQKTFISHLANQLARHQFLKIACQLERKNIASAYSLLRVIESELQSYLSAVNTRLGHCTSLIQAATEMSKQQCQHTCQRMPWFSRYQPFNLICFLFNLNLKVPCQPIAKDASMNLNRTVVSHVVKAVRLTPGSAIGSMPLMRALDDMENANAQVEVSVEEVTKARTQKIKIFENRAHEVGRERQVFVDFFSNPERLKNQVRELTSRVKALQE
uniref:HAUS augmin-like complex subunit 3 N-terminal domain-containing protein n=1 Tax=Oryza nivara TaxID=4536 RepID=A0A0E0HQ09_ORYNI